MLNGAYAKVQCPSFLDELALRSTVFENDLSQKLYENVMMKSETWIELAHMRNAMTYTQRQFYGTGGGRTGARNSRMLSPSHTLNHTSRLSDRESNYLQKI